MVGSALVAGMLDVVAATAARPPGQRADVFVTMVGNVVDVDYAVFCEHDPETDAPLQITVSPGFTPIAGTWEILLECAARDPWLSHVRTTGEVVARRWADIASETDLRRNALVRELYHPAGSRQILNAPVNWGLTNTMVTLSRGGHRGFSEDERDVLELGCRALGNLARGLSSGSTSRALTMSGASPISPGVGHAGVDDAAARTGFTRREVVVLGLVAEGLTTAAAARRLAVSPRTVNKHQEHIYRKLGVTDRLTAVLRAQEARLLVPDRHPALRG